MFKLFKNVSGKPFYKSMFIKNYSKYVLTTKITATVF